jgi:hypothetical protein
MVFLSSGLRSVAAICSKHANDTMKNKKCPGNKIFIPLLFDTSSIPLLYYRDNEERERQRQMTHEFKPCIKQTFVNGNDVIVVRTQDESHGHYWQMEVNGSKSEVSGHYMGVLAHKDYYYCTADWTGVFPVNTPFTITKAVRMTHMDQPQLPLES